MTVHQLRALSLQLIKINGKKRKEHDKILEKTLNEMEISSLPHKEFKVMDMKVLTKLRERMDKHCKNLSKETENIKKKIPTELPSDPAIPLLGIF